ncbi:MAG: hypothetical protein ACNA8L_09980 [Luteolibacter sp.]|jgi:hypothetical protein
MKPRLHSPTPYFDTWLRRTRKHLTASGKLAQVATVLATQDGSAPAAWEEKLRAMLEGEFTPGLEILVRIDGILSGTPKPSPNDTSEQLGLFA